MFFACTDSETYFNDDLIDVTPNSQIPLAKRSDTNINEGQFSPDYEFLKEIEKFLASNDEFLNYQKQLVDDFGTLKWSHSILDVTDEDMYLLCLPFKKNNKYSGLLIITGHHDHIDLNFVQVNTLKQLIHNNNIDEIENYLAYALAKLSYLERIRNNRIIIPYYKTLESIHNFDDTEIETRNVTFTYTEDFVGPTDQGLANLTIGSREITITIGCGGPGLNGSRGGGGESGGGGSSNPGEGDGETGSTFPPRTPPEIDPDNPDEEIEVEDPIEEIEEDCKDNLSNDVIEMINGLSEDTVFPCGESLTEILIALCEESENQSNTDIDPDLLPEIDLNDGIVSDDEIEEGLDGIDHIDYGNLKDECPCLDWLLRKIGKGASKIWLCKLIQDIENSENYDLTINVGEYSTIQNVPLSNGDSRLQIPESLCEISFLDSAAQLEKTAKFIHEFLHSHFFQILADDLPENGFDITDGFEVWKSEEWKELIRKRYNIPENEPITGVHHVDFYLLLKDSIMESIWELNGQNGSIEQYEYYANLMLNTADLASDPEIGTLLGLGEYSQDGTYINNFDNDNYLSAWNSVAGNGKFKLKCGK